MKPLNIKVIFKYTLSLFLAGALLWYVYKDIDLTEMLSRLQFIDYRWYIISIAVALMSHITRAYRWNILLGPFDVKLSTFRTFIAVMVGYFANLIIPRMGEVTRCGMLKKMDDVPVATSFGTVVTERLVDALTLFVIIVVALFLEFDRLSPLFFDFFENVFQNYLPGTTFMFFALIGLGVLLSILFYIFIQLKKGKLGEIAFVKKSRMVLMELVAGMLSIKNIKQKRGFIISTVLIWVFYYLMSFVVFSSMESTSDLGFMAGLSILIMGGIGMSAPVQGGIGTFHILVSSTLLLYGVKEQDGILFATVLHTSQVLMVILTGSICFIVSLFISSKRTKSVTQNA